MKFTTFIALVGVATASRYGHAAGAIASRMGGDCGCAAPVPAPACEYAAAQSCGCAGGAGGMGGAGGFGRKGLSGALNAASRLPAASYGDDNYARLCTESANSNTQISASQYTIPDKNTITDQAKVSQAVSNGSNKEQNCEVASRTFDISGSISVQEKYTNQQRGESTSEQCGEGASQTRSRVQVSNNCCGKAAIPVTSNCAGGAGGAGGLAGAGCVGGNCGCGCA